MRKASQKCENVHLDQHKLCCGFFFNLFCLFDWLVVVGGFVWLFFCLSNRNCAKFSWKAVLQINTSDMMLSDYYHQSE